MAVSVIPRLRAEHLPGTENDFRRQASHASGMNHITFLEPNLPARGLRFREREEMELKRFNDEISDSKDCAWPGLCHYCSGHRHDSDLLLPGPAADFRPGSGVYPAGEQPEDRLPVPEMGGLWLHRLCDLSGVAAVCVGGRRPECGTGFRPVRFRKKSGERSRGCGGICSEVFRRIRCQGIYGYPAGRQNEQKEGCTGRPAAAVCLQEQTPPGAALAVSDRTDQRGQYPLCQRGYRRAGTDFYMA